MSITITRGTVDPSLDEFRAALAQYQVSHPQAEISLYRHGQYSVRVRVIDPDFRGKSRTERHNAVWPILSQLPEETLSDLGMLLLIPPEERESSIVNMEFEDPIPSRL